MLKNFTKSISIPSCLILAIGFFAVVWPIVVIWFIDQSAAGLWEPTLEARIYEWAFGLMAGVGVFVGVDSTLQIKRDSLPSARRKSRAFFLALSALVALASISFDTYVMLLPRGRWFSLHELDYLLATQALPIGWFLHSVTSFFQSKKRRQRYERLGLL